MNIIVTGASSGIGYETVKYFTKAGEHKILAIARNADNLKKLELQCRGINPSSTVLPLALDLTHYLDNEEALREEISKKLPSVDILLNNAGNLINKPFEQVTYRDALRTFQVNLFVPAMLIRIAAGLKGEKLHAVNIGSMGGFQGSSKFPGLSYYSASKASVASLTECLAEEFKEQKISVNCLAIGAAQTEMLEEAFPGMKAPLSAGEMAAFIGHFCLSGDTYFNGKILPVAVSTP